MFFWAGINIIMQNNFRISLIAKRHFLFYFTSFYFILLYFISFYFILFYFSSLFSFSSTLHWFLLLLLSYSYFYLIVLFFFQTCEDRQSTKCPKTVYHFFAIFLLLRFSEFNSTYFICYHIFIALLPE